MKNSILLRRKNKVIVNKGVSILPDVYVGSALKNIENLGYTFSPSLIDTVRTLSVDEFTSFYKQLVKDLKENLGANVVYNPMYPNFPTQVMEASDAELYINAVIHYFSTYFLQPLTGSGLPNGGLPVYEKEERIPLLDNVELKVIELGTDEEFDTLISQLMSSKTSISDTDKKDIEWIISTYPSVDSVLPTEIPLKENVGFIVSLLLQHEKASVAQVSRYFKTATDVLRLATALSDGDVSLAKNTKFRKFKRAERRLMLGLLEKCHNVTEDMLRYKKRWIRLGEILHPSEYLTKFPKTNDAFHVLRNNEKFVTFGGKVERALLDGNYTLAAELLKNRPGEFARRLDHILRNTQHIRFVLASFAEVVHEVSTPVLLQVAAHFKHRNDDAELRTFFPKGNTAKAISIENKLGTIHEDVRFLVVGIALKALTERFSELTPLNKVYLDEKLKDYIVPFSQRSASKSLRTLIRGSKVEMPEGDTIRFFIHWKDADDYRSIDLDLGAVMFGDNWEWQGFVNWQELRNASYNAYHSGDITEAPNGACEFIDLDIPSCVEHNIRYVAMSVNVYRGPNFTQIPECFAGWMVRQHPNSGEIFEPKTVIDKLDVTTDARICVPVILDLKERKVIWCDLALTDSPYYQNTVENNKAGLTELGKAISTLAKPNLYDLFFLHASARGTLVETQEEADTVFSVENGTPFEVETIMSEFLS